MKISTKKLSAQEQLDKGYDKYLYIHPFLARVVPAIMIFICVAFYNHHVNAKKVVTCDSFENQREAQILYESTATTTNKFGYLDKNHDGIACNKLIKTYVR